VPVRNPRAPFPRLGFASDRPDEGGNATDDRREGDEDGGIKDKHFTTPSESYCSLSVPCTQ